MKNSQSTPSTLNLLFCINKNYIDQFIICLSSIVRFKNNYHIFIFHSDLSTHDQEKIKQNFPNILFNFIEINTKQISDFPVTDRYPLEIYFRIFAAQFLPDDIHKILYLDADTLIINPLDELYQINIEDYYYAACTHVRKPLTRINHLRLSEISDNPYINTGVILMNIDKLRREQKKEDVIDYVKQHKRLLLPDQDIISSLYGNKIKIIDSLKYNLSDRILSIYNMEHLNQPITIDWIKRNTSIIHYCGKNKPWHDHYIGVLDIFYTSLLEELNHQ